MKTKLSRKMKKALSVILAVCIMVSVLSTPTYSEAASEKATVYVVSKITTKDGSLSYKYNKNGLVSEIKIPYTNRKFSYTYNKKVLKKTKYSNIKKEIKEGRDITRNDDYKISRDNKGRIKEVISNGYQDFKPDSFKYDKKNRVISFNFQFGGVYDEKISYDKKGRIGKIIVNHHMLATKSITTYKYTYDKKGYVKSIYEKCHSDIGTESEDTTEKTTNYKNSYKKGRLVKRNGNKISYKKISVPKSYKNDIERQQRKLIESSTADGCWGVSGAYYWWL